MRDPSNHAYCKEETGKLMVGFFEPRGKVWRLDGIPGDSSFLQLEEDWEHLGPILQRAVHRVPALAEAGLQLVFNGPEACTPDGHYHLGETPEVDRCFVAAGFNSVGIQSAGGVGWVLADWIVDGHPPMDLWSVDPRRSSTFECDPGFLAERIPESLGLLYAMHWPFHQYETGRGVLTSPLHDRMAAAGAVFGSVAGWERPMWFALPGQEPVDRPSYGRQHFTDAMEAECRAVREMVGLFDQSSFATFSVTGPDALRLLDRLSANAIDVEPGRVVSTPWCNERAGIEADLTVTRRGEAEFLVVTAAATRRRDLAWLTRHARGSRVQIEDRTGRYGVLGVMGPGSRALLSELTSADLSRQAAPFGSARRIEVAGIDTLALRISYVGELGWELYVDAADALALHDAIVATGASHGLRHAGFHAMNSLRLETGSRHWGDDLGDHDTPLEAGLSFAVAFDKPDGFFGREALERQRGQPLTKRLVQLRLEEPDRLLYHDEPILRDGELVGRTTSAMWSTFEQRSLAMGYVSAQVAVDAAFLDTASWQVEVAGTPIQASVALRSFYDPTSARLRG